MDIRRNTDNIDEIDTIVVMPRNRTYARYMINEGDFHARRYDELRSWLLEIAPQCQAGILEHLSKFQHFIVFVKEGVVQRLKIDTAAEMEKIREDTAITNFKKIEKLLMRARSVDRSPNAQQRFQQFSKRPGELFERRPRT